MYSVMSPIRPPLDCLLWAGSKAVTIHQKGSCSQGPWNTWVDGVGEGSGDLGRVRNRRALLIPVYETMLDVIEAKIERQASAVEEWVCHRYTPPFFLSTFKWRTTAQYVLSYWSTRKTWGCVALLWPLFSFHVISKTSLRLYSLPSPALFSNILPTNTWKVKEVFDADLEMKDRRLSFES